MVVVSFVLPFVSSLTPGPGDEWAPCRAVGRMRGYLNIKKKKKKKKKKSPFVHSGSICGLKIAAANLPYYIIVISVKTTVLLSDLFSSLVYPTALVSHAFISVRDVSYARQNRMPLCTHLLYL